MFKEVKEVIESKPDDLADTVEVASAEKDMTQTSVEPEMTKEIESESNVNSNFWRGETWRKYV